LRMLPVLQQLGDAYRLVAQMIAECPYTLQWDAPFPSKLLLPMGGRIWTPSNTWFPGLTQVLNPNGIMTGSAVFAGLCQTYRPTDHTTWSVTIGHIVQWPFSR